MGGDATARIVALVEDGAATMAEVGRKLGCTGERVRQLICRLPPAERDRVRALLAENREERDTRLSGVEAFGERKPRYRWARDERCAVDAATFDQRIATGWDPEEALTTPLLRAGEQRPSLRRQSPPPLPAEDAAALARLSQVAAHVRGGAPADGSGRAAALERDVLVRRLLLEGHTAVQIAVAAGRSTRTVHIWMHYALGRRERYQAR